MHKEGASQAVPCEYVQGSSILELLAESSCRFNRIYDPTQLHGINDRCTIAVAPWRAGWLSDEDCFIIISYSSERRKTLMAPRCSAFLCGSEQAQAKACCSKHPSCNGCG
jgi:hypothetical protein